MTKSRTQTSTKRIPQKRRGVEQRENDEDDFISGAEDCSGDWLEENAVVSD
jgi:hypothetical protein